MYQEGYSISGIDLVPAAADQLVERLETAGAKFDKPPAPAANDPDAPTVWDRVETPLEETMERQAGP